MNQNDAPDDVDPDDADLDDAGSSDANPNDVDGPDDVANPDDAEDSAHVEGPTGVENPTDVHLVGPATAEVLAGADFEASGIPEKTVSYEMLIDAGVNPGVATRLRKEHSLHWSFGGSEESDDSLEERSEKIRGLQDDERAWVAASSGDWESAEPETTESTGGDWSPTGEASTDGREASTDGSGAAEAAEAAWRERSKPDPVTDVPGVDEEIAQILANGGITSVRSLSTADPEHVADSLGLDVARVTEWRDAARDLA